MKFDNGRRQGTDRRQEDIGYDDSHPIFKWDRRSGQDRRTAKDRRREYEEKRKYKRFKVKGGLFVDLYQTRLFKLKRKWSVSQVEILDFNTRGIRLQYLGSGTRALNFETLSIGTIGNEGRVQDLPFKVITDHKVSDHPDGGQVRECGLQFHTLTSNQKARLSYFIKQWSIRSASRESDLPEHLI
jgi:hypothetical protein